MVISRFLLTAAAKLPLRLFFSVLAPPLLLLTSGPEVASDAQEPSQFQISVNVDLVVLHVTVRERSGAPAPKLKREDFDIFEDGVKQDLRIFRHEDSPVTVGLIVDHSGSMRGKLEEVTTAARTFVQQSSPADEMFVVNFNEKVTLGLPSNIKMSNRPDQLAKAISGTPPEGMTALYDAVLTGLDRLREGSHEKKVLVVVSDGGDTASRHKVDEVIQAVERSAALVYTLGIFDDSDPDRNPQVLRRLARATGGDVFFPSKPNEIVDVCERIAKEIRHQYTLAYVSRYDGKPRPYRSVRVTVRSPGTQKLVVRTRAGYASDVVPQIKKGSAVR